MPSFDIVSRTDLPEVDNAIHGAMREIGTRFDFKGSISCIKRNDEGLTIEADDELKLKQVQELLRGNLAKRKVDARALDFRPSKSALGNTIRQHVLIKQGIDRELAQNIIKRVKSLKAKLQVTIQGDTLRVSCKKRDTLQDAIQLLKQTEIRQPLQYVNFRD